jgi:hypothetical protein
MQFFFAIENWVEKVYNHITTSLPLLPIHEQKNVYGSNYISTGVKPVIRKQYAWGITQASK